MYEQPQPNYTTQPHYPAPPHVVGDRRHVDWRLTGAYIIAALAVGVACACLWLFHSYKVTTQAQITQIRHTLASAQTAQSKSASTIDKLSGRISSAEAELVLLSPYGMVCSTYLTGPSGGPATFWFPCSPQKPGSGS
jgi:uncharacterized protein HemX